MSLDAAARRRYARQVLLAEIGEEGQERLSRARFGAGEDVDSRAFAVAADYLARAGCEPSEDGPAVVVPSEAFVNAFAGRETLRAPAAAVVGAFAAVEHLKRMLEVGTPGALSDDSRLTDET